MKTNIAKLREAHTPPPIFLYVPSQLAVWYCWIRHGIDHRTLRTLKHKDTLQSVPINQFKSNTREALGLDCDRYK